MTSLAQIRSVMNQICASYSRKPASGCYKKAVAPPGGAQDQRLAVSSVSAALQATESLSSPRSPFVIWSPRVQLWRTISASSLNHAKTPLKSCVYLRSSSLMSTFHANYPLIRNSVITYFKAANRSIFRISSMTSPSGCFLKAESTSLSTGSTKQQPAYPPCLCS